MDTAPAVTCRIESGALDDEAVEQRAAQPRPEAGELAADALGVAVAHRLVGHRGRVARWRRWGRGGVGLAGLGPGDTVPVALLTRILGVGIPACRGRLTGQGIRLRLVGPRTIRIGWARMGPVELKVVRYEVDDGVAVVTLDRPDRLNAWTGRMHTEYRWALAEAGDDAEVRVIVVTGEGRGFCAGADAAALDGHVAKGAYDPGVVADELATPGYGVRPEFDHAFAFHFGIPKPIVAAVNGAGGRRGAGARVLLRHPLRRRRSEAHHVGAAARAAGRVRAVVGAAPPRRHGPRGRPPAVEPGRARRGGRRMGLVNRVLPADELLPYASAYARMLATEVSPSSRPRPRPSSTPTARRRRHRGGRERGAPRALVRGPDFAEGVAALSEKRAPRFCTAPRHER